MDLKHCFIWEQMFIFFYLKKLEPRPCAILSIKHPFPLFKASNMLCNQENNYCCAVALHTANSAYHAADGGWGGKATASHSSGQSPFCLQLLLNAMFPRSQRSCGKTGAEWQVLPALAMLNRGDVHSKFHVLTLLSGCFPLAAHISPRCQQSCTLFFSAAAFC